MAGKMSPKFVALCTVAVGAIYSTGYAITTNSNTALAAPTSQQHATTPPAGAANGSGNSNGSSGTNGSGNSTNSSGSSKKSTSSNTTGSSSGASSTSSKSTNTPAKKKTNTAQKYLDGTYQGSAQNQIGMVSVAVSIKNGKIGNVHITACDTHYPQSYIDPVLPDYVVQHQTTQIPVISGATLSTADFYYAVVQALQQAQNPHYKG